MPLLLDCDRTHSALYHYRLVCIGGPYHQSGRLSFWLSLLQALLCKAQTEISAETPLGLQRLSCRLACHRRGAYCKLLRPDQGYTRKNDLKVRSAKCKVQNESARCKCEIQNTLERSESISRLGTSLSHVRRSRSISRRPKGVYLTLPGGRQYSQTCSHHYNTKYVIKYKEGSRCRGGPSSFLQHNKEKT